jgi:hypothetical protein
MKLDHYFDLLQNYTIFSTHAAIKDATAHRCSLILQIINASKQK